MLKGLAVGLTDVLCVGGKAGPKTQAVRSSSNAPEAMQDVCFRPKAAICSVWSCTDRICNSYHHIPSMFHRECSKDSAFSPVQTRKDYVSSANLVQQRDLDLMGA